MQPNLPAIVPIRQSTRRLTPRERQVLDVAELKRSDIAATLGMSEATAKVHLRRLFDLAGVDNRAALVAWRERRAA